MVLVNEDTTGAAEAVGAALQDHQRATVLGSNTAGRGKVTSTLTCWEVPMEIPVARLVRPGGRALDGIGVGPDFLKGGRG
ncbi:S41 family peptidase [Anaeromyxobacter paludicola]|uniref:S41 family peptidase n=1 Tax=Anaeromyxobacter paludicola TaxID=2918171 RepID=UPI0020BEB6E0|nr:S41 family peptidase [Anaeromyxobacter paludicola]